MIHGALPFRGTRLSQLHLYLWVFSKISEDCSLGAQKLEVAWEFLSTSSSPPETGGSCHPSFFVPGARSTNAHTYLVSQSFTVGSSSGHGDFLATSLPFLPYPHPHWYYLHFPNYSQILALKSTLGEPKLKGDNFKDRDKTPGGEDLFLAII